MSSFTDIMQYLSPKEVIVHTEVPHDNARACFLQQSSILKNHQECQDVLISYVGHHMAAVFHHTPPPEFCLYKARNFLESVEGYDNAVFISLSGTKGGVNYVLNIINDQFKQEAKKAYFDFVIDHYVDPLSFDETVELMRELKQKLGAYSPNAFNYIAPESMAAHHKEIIWSYIESLTNYRNLWTY